MTVAELMHGRGAPTPLHELAVDWPQYWAYRERVRERQENSDAQVTLK